MKRKRESLLILTRIPPKSSRNAVPQTPQRAQPSRLFSPGNGGGGSLIPFLWSSVSTQRFLPRAPPGSLLPAAPVVCPAVWCLNNRPVYIFYVELVNERLCSQRNPNFSVKGSLSSSEQEEHADSGPDRPPGTAPLSSNFCLLGLGFWSVLDLQLPSLKWTSCHVIGPWEG